MIAGIRRLLLGALRLIMFVVVGLVFMTGGAIAWITTRTWFWLALIVVMLWRLGGHG